GPVRLRMRLDCFVALTHASCGVLFVRLLALIRAPRIRAACEVSPALEHGRRKIRARSPACQERLNSARVENLLICASPLRRISVRAGKAPADRRDARSDRRAEGGR